MSVIGPRPDPGQDGQADARVDAVVQRAVRMAHDFNNVFTIISGYATLMRDALASGDLASLDIAQLVEDMELVCDAARRGVMLTRRLADIAHEAESASDTGDGEGASPDRAPDNARLAGQH